MLESSRELVCSRLLKHIVKQRDQQPSRGYRKIEGDPVTSAVEEVAAPVPVLGSLVHNLGHQKSVTTSPEIVTTIALARELALPGPVPGRCSQRIESPLWRDCPVHNNNCRQLRCNADGSKSRKILEHCIGSLLRENQNQSSEGAGEVADCSYHGCQADSEA